MTVQLMKGTVPQVFHASRGLNLFMVDPKLATNPQQPKHMYAPGRRSFARRTPRYGRFPPLDSCTPGWGSLRTIQPFQLDLDWA